MTNDAVTKPHLPLLLIFAVLIRLPGIGLPLADHHAWRQTDTAAIARNFYTNGFRLFHPQIDWGGAGPGYVECEFQIFPFLAALVYGGMGVREIVGRLLSVAWFTLGLVLLYRLLRRDHDETFSLTAGLLYAILPINVYFTRAFMPEAMLITCSIGLVYWFAEWVEKGRVQDYVLAAIAGTLAFLIKLPTLYMGLPLLHLCCRKHGKRFLAQPSLWLFCLLTFLPTAAWYAHAHQLGRAYGNSFRIWEFGTDKWGNFHFLLRPIYYRVILVDRFAGLVMTPVGFGLFLLGLFGKDGRTRPALYRYWLAALVVYLIIVTRGNLIHDYYQLPFAPVAAYFAARGLFRALSWVRGLRVSPSLRRPISMLFPAVTVIVIALLSFAEIVGFYVPNEKLLSASQRVRELTREGDRIVSIEAGAHQPEMFYLSQRRGWHLYRDASVAQLRDALNDGARAVVFLLDGSPRENATLLTRNPLTAYARQHLPLLVETESHLIFGAA